MKTGTIAAREAAGRAAREHLKRSAHRQTGPVARDPLERLAMGNAGRAPALARLRHGRMLASPFAFFVGSAVLQTHDLGLLPNTGIAIPICGDAHLLNFAVFASAGRQPVFDFRDFDEVSTAPWEWDLKRLVASLVLAARQRRCSRGATETMVMAAVGEYRDRTRQYAEYGALELWHEKIPFDRMIETALAPDARRPIRRAMEKAASRTHESQFDKLAHRDGDRWTIRDAAPSIVDLRRAAARLEADDGWFDADHWRSQIGTMIDGYRKTLAHDRRELFGHFEWQDLAYDVTGAGARSLVLLAADQRGRPLFLQIREAHRPALANVFPATVVKHEGSRIVGGERLLRADDDLFLGWSTGPAGRQVYFRQLREARLAADIELFDGALLADYARLCGWAMARAHAKAGNAAIAVAAYIGRGDAFADALTGYAFAYADQVERDYEMFVNAVRRGALDARTDADLAADFGSA